jgi:hypothetical protein
MSGGSTSSRQIAAQIAANERWARVGDRSAATATARAAFLDRFVRQVDPDGVLPSDEQERRARSALRAHMARLRLKSAAKRRGAVGNASRPPQTTSSRAEGHDE